MASLSWSCQHLDSSAFALRLDKLESEEKHYAKTVLASSNSIHVIKEGAFLGFRKLESLQLGFNKLVTFPLAVCVLAETLVTLNISCNAITHLPEELGQLSQLKQLIVRENKLVNIPKSIGNLTKLQLFDAAKNRLEVIPNEFCRCKSILRLDLEQNRIRMLPWDFDRLSSIQILRLRDNPVPDYCGQNVASSVAVKALIQRFVAPLACYKACYSFLAIWSYCQDELCPGHIPKDVVRIIIRIVLETKHSSMWLSVKSE